MAANTRLKMRRNVDSIRRSEIGAEKRSRTLVILIRAALELFGREDGRLTRIEDVCAKAHVSRGTFYNYFTGMDALIKALSNHISEDFDAAVHRAFEALPTFAEQTCVAIRNYLRRAIEDPQWGWAMVNTGIARPMYGENIFRRVRETLQGGIDSGEFTLESADVGRDLLLGTGLAATLTLLQGGASEDYPERVAYRILLAIGVKQAVAAKLVRRPLPALAGFHSGK
jgi:AcrR family transcriptional regulator